MIWSYAEKFPHPSSPTNYSVVSSSFNVSVITSVFPLEQAVHHHTNSRSIVANNVGFTGASFIAICRVVFASCVANEKLKVCSKRTRLVLLKNTVEIKTDVLKFFLISRMHKISQVKSKLVS